MFKQLSGQFFLSFERANTCVKENVEKLARESESISSPQIFRSNIVLESSKGIQLKVEGWPEVGQKLTFTSCHEKRCRIHEIDLNTVIRFPERNRFTIESSLADGDHILDPIVILMNNGSEDNATCFFEYDKSCNKLYVTTAKDVIEGEMVSFRYNLFEIDIAESFEVYGERVVGLNALLKDSSRVDDVLACIADYYQDGSTCPKNIRDKLQEYDLLERAFSKT